MNNYYADLLDGVGVAVVSGELVTDPENRPTFRECLNEWSRRLRWWEEADRSRFRKQKQAFLHRPEEGQYGDCHRTAIACVLGVDRDSIPNWGVYAETPDLFEQEAQKYLSTQGLRSVSFPMWAGEEKGPEDVLNWFGTRNPGVTYLLTGKSRNGTNHVVICKDKEIVWDTAIDDSGIVAPIENGWYEIELLVTV